MFCPVGEGGRDVSVEGAPDGDTFGLGSDWVWGALLGDAGRLPKDLKPSRMPDLTESKRLFFFGWLDMLARCKRYGDNRVGSGCAARAGLRGRMLEGGTCFPSARGNRAGHTRPDRDIPPLQTRSLQRADGPKLIPDHDSLAKYCDCQRTYHLSRGATL